MMRLLRIIYLCTLILPCLCLSALAESRAISEQWLIELKQEALTKGISAKTIDNALANVSFNPKIIALDNKQAEFTYTIWDYLSRMVTDARLNHARQMLKKHRKILSKIEKEYGVPKEYILSFWGMESNFGVNFGGFNVIEALVTLAYDSRRPELFRKELLVALKILDEGHISLSDMKGSWAGAMGNFQFLPSTYMSYAVDYDNDGHKDIWGSLPDAFASAANYLKKIGWQNDQRWGREVTLPKNLSWLKLTSRPTRTPPEWGKAGINPTYNKKFIGGENINATIIFPGGHNGPIFLTYPNFQTIKKWNNSVFYAIAIGHFADRITGEPKLATKPVKLYNPDKEQIKEFQTLLIELGYLTGKADGISGKATREAIAKAQRNYGLPIDSYPSQKLLNNMRRDVQQISGVGKAEI